MIYPGRVWGDTNGKPIQSHSGSVLCDNGIYYWCGTNWDGPTIPPGTLPNQAFSWFFNRGITIYRSTELVTWEHAGTVLTEVEYGVGSLLQPLNGLVRPKMIKNDATGKFILMAALISPDFDSFNDVIVAESDSPLGPFKLRGKLPWRGKPNLAGLWNRTWSSAAEDLPSRIRGFDMTLFKDDDGKGYLVSSRIDAYLYELTDDYLGVVHVEKMDGIAGEAPALFKAGNVYFAVTSQLTGWAPNQNTYCTSTSIHGPWSPAQSFATGPREETTFDSQAAYVLPVTGKPDAFIFIADRFNAVSDSAIPDLRMATHVWLPIQLDLKNRVMRVPWRDSWDPTAFDQP